MFEPVVTDIIVDEQHKPSQELAPEPVAEPMPEPEPLPPVLGSLVVMQADSVVQPPVLGAVAVKQVDSVMIPHVRGMLFVTQRDSVMKPPVNPPPAREPLPPLPEPDFGTLEFWNEHPFFQPPASSL